MKKKMWKLEGQFCIFAFFFPRFQSFALFWALVQHCDFLDLGYIVKISFNKEVLSLKYYFKNLESWYFNKI